MAEVRALNGFWMELDGGCVAVCKRGIFDLNLTSL